MTVIGIDGDDTLWRNEEHFRAAEEHFAAIVGNYYDGDDIADQLLAIEMGHVEIYGFGVKGFTLSMIETANALSGGQVSAEDIGRILELGHDLLRVPIELLDGVGDALEDLASTHQLLLITKGDLQHQQRKVEASGLATHFDDVHVVAHKDPPTYKSVLDRHRLSPANFMMVGNSVNSDVLPVLELGGRAVHIPYHMTWAAEVADDDTHEAATGFTTVAHLRDVAGLLRPAGEQL